MRSFRLIFTCFAIVFLFGCSHHLEIKNLDDYQASSLHTLPKDFTIGVSTSNTEKNGKLLVTGLANGLSKYTGSVIYPYYPSSAKSADLVTNVTVRSDHKGSGWNFLINFPGFLIWAPAWNGYVYRPSYDVDIELLRGSDLSKLDTFSVPIDLNVRHAEMDRTWTEISWFEVGIIALVGGIVFTEYDTDVTPLLEREIKIPIGDYLAQEIASRITSTDIIERIKAEKIAGAELNPAEAPH